MYLSDFRERTMPTLVMLPTQLGSVVEHYVRKLHEMISLRAYELFEQRGCQHGGDLDDWLQAEQDQTPVEIADADSELIVSVQVQGFEERELDVIVDASQVLVIRKPWLRPKEDKQETPDRMQRNISDAEPSPELVRFIPLPCSIIPEKATVRLHHDGFIEVNLPKATIKTG